MDTADIDLDYLRKNIDYTNVRPDSSKDDISAFCNQALGNFVKTIYVPPVFVAMAVSLCKEDVDVGTTAGFPFGSVPAELKEHGIRHAAKNGARWVDVCLNLSSVKSRKYSEAAEEIKQLISTARENGIGLKLIIESPLLNEEELVKLTRMADSYGIDYLKTSTGITNKVSEREIRIIKPLLTNTRLNVAGRISTLEEALKYFQLGADKIGSTSGFKIFGEALEKEV